MQIKCWILKLCCGQYDDYTEKNHAVYLDKEKAEKAVVEWNRKESKRKRRRYTTGTYAELDEVDLIS